MWFSASCNQGPREHVSLEFLQRRRLEIVQACGHKRQMASSFALVSEQLGLVGGILGRFGHLAGGLEAFGRTVFRVPAAYLRLALWAFLAYWA